MFSRALAGLFSVALLAGFTAAIPSNTLEARQNADNIVYVTDAQTFW